MDEEKKVDEEELKEEEANTKAAHALGKGAATYFGGPVGNKIYNVADRLGVAKPIEKLAGKAINYTPGLNQASKMLNEAGLLDAADKAIDVAGGKGLDKDGLSKETLAKEGLEDSTTNSSSDNNSKSTGSAKSDGSSSSSGSSSGATDAETESKFPKWIFIVLGIIIFLPLILLLIIVIVTIIGFLAPGLGVIDFFSGIIGYFNSEKALMQAEADYYEHLEEAQQTAFQNYNVCIDVNLIHATLTVDKFGDISLEEGEEPCDDLESCTDEYKDVLTVSDYKKMEKYIDILVNMQIKRKKYALYTKECHTSSSGDRCGEGKTGEKVVKVTASNLHCADITWLDSIDYTWQGIPFRDSSTPRLVAGNDKDTIFKFFTKKANREKNYEYYLYVPAATYIQNEDGTETRKCELKVPDNGYEFAEVDIGDWNTMEDHIYFYNLLDSFVEEYYTDYLNTGDVLSEVGSDRYTKATALIDRIYDYYTLLGENRNCSQSSEYICRDDEGSDYYGGGETSLERREFIEKISPLAIEEMERTGAFASITIAQAAVESRNGASGLSSKYANYYGMIAGNCAPKGDPSVSRGEVLASGEGGNTCQGNAFWDGSVVALCNSSGNDCQWYRIYDSFKNSTMDHSRLVSEAYGCNQSTYKEYLTCIVDHGYASNPNYKKTLLSVIDRYDLTDYDIGVFDGSVEPITVPQYTNQICVGGSVIGDWANWKQYDPTWSGVALGPSTVGKIGCAMTSVSIQIARSGVSTTLGTNFNPGTFAKALTKVGGFDARGNIYWSKVSEIAPNFIWTGTRVYGYVSPSTINSLIGQGYYVILNVKGGRHWVAVDRVEGNRIYMFDPGSGGTEVGQTYGLNSIVGYTLYKKG